MRSLNHLLPALPLVHLLSGCIIIGPGDSASGSGTDATSGTTDATAGTTDATSGGASEGSASASGSTGALPTTGATTGGAADTPAKSEDACAPDDGPATEYKLGIAQRECAATFPDDAPTFRIVVFQGGPLAVGEYPLGPDLGFAYLESNGMPVTGNVGTLTITTVTADGSQGSYDVTLSDNTHLVGDFDAIDCPSGGVCG